MIPRIHRHLITALLLVISPCVNVRTVDGRLIDAPDRATSYPSNPWEFLNSKRDQNYTHCIPLTADLTGQSLDIVVLAGESCSDDLQPVVWQTARETPFCHRNLTLLPTP